jgi:Nucleotidyl transferase AbiEii toxin, Type IV TA system
MHQKGSSVSGERILLVDGADGRITDLVRATALVVEHAGLPVALIGGLAVTCRLAAAHRVTQDVDLVAETPVDLVAEPGSVADNLVSAGVARAATDTSSIRLFIGVTKVEIIETQRLNATEAADIEPERSRLFILAHRWALETATAMTISVTEAEVQAILPVATPAALVTMKLHSIQDRSQDRKRASDAWDLFRLLQAHNAAGEITAAIAHGPPGLAPIAAAALDRIFRIDVTRTRRWIHGYGEPAWTQLMTDDALADLAIEVIEGLTP